MQWFDIQWQDTNGNTCITHEFAENKLAAKSQFQAKIPAFAQNGSQFKCFDFIAPNGPLPLTEGCCLR